jgi:hypothetical protein|tara:strand:- start:687 stop:953 length:267 start_codon:yes stop_codon:yes gene_type:complete
MAKISPYEAHKQFKELVDFVKSIKVLNWMGDNQIIINTILMPKLKKLRKLINDDNLFYTLLQDFIKQESLEEFDIGTEIIKNPEYYEE